ncbi:hypothetical protein HDK77DRAFT_131525 [Phyllosticta capitalensis]
MCEPSRTLHTTSSTWRCCRGPPPLFCLLFAQLLLRPPPQTRLAAYPKPDKDDDADQDYEEPDRGADGRGDQVVPQRRGAGRVEQDGWHWMVGRGLVSIGDEKDRGMSVCSRGRDWEPAGVFRNAMCARCVADKQNQSGLVYPSALPVSLFSSCSCRPEAPPRAARTKKKTTLPPCSQRPRYSTTHNALDLRALARERSR